MAVSVKHKRQEVIQGITKETQWEKVTHQAHRTDEENGERMVRMVKIKAQKF